MSAIGWIGLFLIVAVIVSGYRMLWLITVHGLYPWPKLCYIMHVSMTDCGHSLSKQPCIFVIAATIRHSNG